MYMDSLVERVLLPEEEVLDAHELLEEVGHVDGQLGAPVDHLHGAVGGHLLLQDLGLLHHGDLERVMETCLSSTLQVPFNYKQSSAEVVF